MKDEFLESDTLDNPPSINHEKLADALRQDMQNASKEVLRCRSYVDILAEHPRSTYFEKLFANTIISYLDDILSILDCVEHLKGDENATS